jgi:hypothetical protein
MRNNDMCEHCKLIDDRIARYRLLSFRINDQQALEGIRNLIRQLEAEKEALHRDERGDAS